MLNQVTIQSRAKRPIKPLVELALQNQLKNLSHGIRRTKQKLADFEARFGMTTREFENKLRAGEIEETLDTIDWYMEVEALRILEEEYNALRDAHVD
jgi:hypothetical protein